MKRFAGPITLAMLFTALVVTLVVTTPSMSAPSGGKHELILMRCDMDQGVFKVTTYSTSQSAPPKTTDNCAESLASHHRHGFTIEDVGYFDAGEGYIVYTLSR